MAKQEYSFTGLLQENGKSQLVSSAYASVKQTVIFEGMGRSSVKPSRVEIDDAELVEVELDSITLLMTFEELKACALYEAGRGSTSNLLPSTITGNSSERGVVGFAIRALRILGLNLPAKAIDVAAQHIESTLSGDGPGLYKVAEDGTLFKHVLPVDDKPVLLLLHGTASSTQNAFARLLPNKEGSKKNTAPDGSHYWQTLYEAFGGRVFALEQKTLTETPITNLLQFLAQWPSAGGPPLVLLSHSRGGIVGDFLSSLRDWEEQPRGLLDALSPGSIEKNQLLDLQTKIITLEPRQRPSVLRHIRVGTPAAGTSLASDKTHIWLSVLASLSGAIPGVGGGLGAIGDIAVATVKEALKPGVLPGIDAQKPDSDFVKIAQLLSCKNTDLLAVTGSCKGVLKRTLGAIFGDDNDLIVNTRSMLLGPQYKSKYQLPISDEVIDHISYFSHSELRANLKPALMGEYKDSDFKTLGQTPAADRGHVKPGQLHDHKNMPCMFLLPGIMGSELSAGDDQKAIWLAYTRLIMGGGEQLQIDNPSVSASGVLETGYSNFVDHVRAKNEFHVIPFGYDWRKPIVDSIDKLEEQIQHRLKLAGDQPIVFVCHSMGGLVARAWRQKHEATWKAIVKGGGRIVQLGTPNYGSWTIARIFRGEEKILTALALADLKHDEAYWLTMVSKFPGLLELCCFDSSTQDMAERKSWREIGAKVIPTAARLKAAKANFDVLKTDEFQADKDIIYVAGISEKTPALKMSEKGPEIVDEIYSGDGRVLWPKDEEGKVDYYMHAMHGDLLNSKAHFDAVIDLATNGKTSKLSARKPPFDKSGASRSSELAIVRERLGLSKDECLFPTVTELEAAALGGSDSTVYIVEDADESLTLSVTHGNLMYCKHPVLVGHYVGDGIKRAERSLDSKLNDVLTQRWNLGAEFYAGKVGTHEVAVRLEKDKDKPGPTGAVVVGLGRMGELQKGDLITTVRNGVLKYAQVCAEKGQDCSSLKLASLLIGSGQEALELLDVLDGIVDGVMAANKILKQKRSANSPTVRISELEFIEWHLDVAIDARHKLANLPSNLTFKPMIKTGLGKTAGGHKRAHLQEDSDWWDSLKVRTKSPDYQQQVYSPLTTLAFSVLGGKALGMSGSVKFNQREIDTFLKPILSNTNAPLPDQVEALFEQLVPPGLKSMAAQRRNLVINMDPESAYLPWEILIDRKSHNSKPMAVAGGMVRRIISDGISNEHVLSAEENAALVVGNPPGGPMFQSLSGAYEESKQIVQVLKDNGWEVNEKNVFENASHFVNQETAASIRQDIFVKDYRILHFAAHGVHDGQDPSNSGVVIGYDDAAGMVELFSPHHVRAIRHKPSLVFVNCCHAGKVEDWSFHKLSASLAAEFIKSGVHCVIGAGWAVDDNAALDFARTVYSRLLNGDNFGFAVRRAREAVYSRYPNTNTWAAFQCYGDPGFLLSRRVSGNNLSQEESFYDISELLCELENLRSDLSGSKGPGSSGSRLRTLRSTNELFEKAEEIRDENSGLLWSQLGDVLTHFAIIYCELDEENKALEFLKLASSADCSKVSLDDLLSVANYKARYAERRFYEIQNDASLQLRTKPESTAEQKECCGIIKSTVKSFELYQSIHQGPSVRQGLASAYKLSAMVAEPGKARDDLIKAMIEEYTKSINEKDKDAYYPASNAVLGYILLRNGKGAKPSDLAEIVRLNEIVRESLSGMGQSNFWDLVAKIDTDLILALDKGVFDENVASELALKVVEAAKQFGSAGQLDSIAKQFRCIEILSTDPSVSKAAKHAYDIIKEESLTG